MTRPDRESSEPGVIRIVADLGNSRLKWGRLDAAGALAATAALPLDDPEVWAGTLDSWAAGGAEISWAIASVNPPLADRLAAFLGRRGIGAIRWFRSAADVPVPHDLDRPETAGADRALAVLAAIELHRSGRSGLVVSCGTALTVERVDVAGIWAGGAIAPGLGLSARGLNRLTAQLPLVAVDGPGPAWGTSTEPAIAAGLFWGTLGAIRELVARQSQGLGPGTPWLVWTGGEAALFAPWIEWPGATTCPHLVLMGLARAGFASPPP